MLFIRSLTSPSPPTAPPRRRVFAIVLGDANLGNKSALGNDDDLGMFGDDFSVLPPLMDSASLGGVGAAVGRQAVADRQIDQGLGVGGRSEL